MKLFFIPVKLLNDLKINTKKVLDRQKRHSALTIKSF